MKIYHYTLEIQFKEMLNSFQSDVEEKLEFSFQIKFIVLFFNL
jgi:hypothetical protein